MAQQESIRLAKELDISADDPLYTCVSDSSQWSDESINQVESSLQNIKSIPSWDKFGLMGKLMGYATRGKFQGYLFLLVWLLMAISVLALSILSSPFWIPATIYQRWKRNRT